MLVYLVASHHGKVRVALHAAPKDQEYRDRDGRGLPIRGVREGDRLPAMALDPAVAAMPALTLTLEPARAFDAHRGQLARTLPRLLERSARPDWRYLESVCC